MFRWLEWCLGLSRRNASNSSEYDLVYGLPRRAIDDWLAMNPRLAAEHKAEEQLAQDRRKKAAGKVRDPDRRCKNTDLPLGQERTVVEVRFWWN